MSRSRKLYTALGAGAILAVLVLVLWPTPDTPRPDPEAVASAADKPAPSGAAGGNEMARLNVHETPKEVPDIAFTTPDGPATLADYAGKVSVVNFWATWCAPCRSEMPHLDALAGSRDDIRVVAIATARTNAEAAQRFLNEIGVENIETVTDTDGLSRALGILGLPVTLILDKQGREIARMQGDANWNSPEAHALLDQLVES